MSYVLVTGGAGFIGTNLVNRLATKDFSVLIFDNLARAGVERNLEWLLARHSTRVRFMDASICNEERVERAVQGASTIFHLAGQVAVTDSLLNPVTDFEVNARGTLNLLEAIRKLDKAPFLLYTSTNRVFRNFDPTLLEEGEFRYNPLDPEIREFGLNENHPTEFLSPHACSKGISEQYVIDYSRRYGIPAVVFRLGSVYGPHQRGTEEHDWIAHFTKQALTGNSITFYGSGKQVRDGLYVSDLVDAFFFAREHHAKTRGHIFNIGGGPSNSLSLIETINLLENRGEKITRILKESWRTFDQRYCVSDTRKFKAFTGWQAKTPLNEGLDKLADWLQDDNT